MNLDNKSYVHLLRIQIPKEKHDALIGLNNRDTDLFKYRAVCLKVFEYTNTLNVADSTTIANTIFARQDEDFNIEQFTNPLGLSVLRETFSNLGV